MARVANEPRPRLVERPDNRRLVDLAYESISRGILEGSIPAGTRLIELDLAVDLAMSRAPIREALRRLAAEGLVEAFPRRGHFVRTFDPDELADLYSFRLAIEVTAIRMCVLNQIDVAPLREVLAAQQKAVADKDADAVARLGFEIHARICSMSGNRVIARVFESMEGQFRLAISLIDARTASPRKIVAAHRSLIDAIEARDVDHACQALIDHLQDMVGETIAKLGGDPRRLITPILPPR